MITAVELPTGWRANVACATMKHKIISIPPVYFFICIIATALLRRLVPGMNWIGFPFTIGGMVFLCAGTLRLALTHRSLTRHATPLTFATSTCIIEDGLYNLSRNPM